MSETPTPERNPLGDLLAVISELEAIERQFIAQPVPAQARFARTVQLAKTMAPCLDEIQGRLRAGWTLDDAGQQIFIAGSAAFANLLLTLSTYGLVTNAPYSVALLSSLSRPGSETHDEDEADALFADLSESDEDEDDEDDDDDPIGFVDSVRDPVMADYAGDALELWVVPGAPIGVALDDLMEREDAIQIHRAAGSNVRDFLAALAFMGIDIGVAP